jgi:hypothetical protein
MCFGFKVILYVSSNFPLKCITLVDEANLGGRHFHAFACVSLQNPYQSQMKNAVQLMSTAKFAFPTA